MKKLTYVDYLKHNCLFLAEGFCGKCQQWFEQSEHPHAERILRDWAMESRSRALRLPVTHVVDSPADGDN